MKYVADMWFQASKILASYNLRRPSDIYICHSGERCITDVKKISASLVSALSKVRFFKCLLKWLANAPQSTGHVSDVNGPLVGRGRTQELLFESPSSSTSCVILLMGRHDDTSSLMRSKSSQPILLKESASRFVLNNISTRESTSFYQEL
jgi:hypothetical protein